MGLLDDAIREHLELKRRHGAEAGELAKLEREAFGPVRGAPEPLEVPEPVAPAGVEGDPVLTEPQVDAPDYEEPPRQTPEPAAAAAPDPPVAAEPEPAPAPEPEPEDAGADLAWEDAATEGPEPVQETVSFSPADVAEAEGRRAPAEETGEPEDVLEETPDFLQETPEHDRLWFEQRPPRDFDFDG